MVKYGKGLSVLTHKQMLAQIKAANASENLVNKIRLTKYSLYGPKEITKNIYSNTMNLIKL